MIRRWLWPHEATEDALPSTALSELKEAILNSPYLAETDLNEGFTGTSGFTLLFHLEERERVQALIPEVEPFLDKAIKPEANVFFLNPLVLHAGGAGVAPHADKTLVSYLDGDPPFPFCVSVLYLSLPKEKKGGTIVFHRAIGRLQKTPVENLLLEFPGWLLHEVTPLSSEPGSPPRVSLVLEQYRLSPEMKAAVPRFSLETSRAFSEFLEEFEETEDFEADVGFGDDAGAVELSEPEEASEEDRVLPAPAGTQAHPAPESCP